jgi:Asp-tRNA(Asn)/Glu-tRNA(Gln) amidotransferase C subunit
VKISEKEVRYVADLANLKLTDEEVHRMEIGRASCRERV